MKVTIETGNRPAAVSKHTYSDGGGHSTDLAFQKPNHLTFLEVGEGQSVNARELAADATPESIGIKPEG